MPRTSRPHPPCRSGRRRRPTVLPVLACLGVTALSALTGCSTDNSLRTEPASRSSHSPSRAMSPVTGARPGPPVHISIPSIGVDSDIMRLGLQPDGTVEVPPADKGMTTGWYTGGPVPGARGPAVLIGHNDTRYGRAVFHDLKKITKGADIAVHDGRGTELHFKVTGRETASKKAFPTERVYGRTQDRALRLITCDGAFNAQGHPVDNLIVYAVKV
ncbi:class F sortase [Streptomyces tubercidicus]|uniref:class F sortase n=1 Tax=Streptomyces tubercidicus TaxID=47759 RepID=UPI002E111F7F|nr:class F sortase [Streptomyces tubercidicus]